MMNSLFMIITHIFFTILKTYEMSKNADLLIGVTMIYIYMFIIYYHIKINLWKFKKFNQFTISAYCSENVVNT